MDAKKQFGELKDDAKGLETKRFLAEIKAMPLQDEIPESWAVQDVLHWPQRYFKEKGYKVLTWREGIKLEPVVERFRDHDRRLFALILRTANSTELIRAARGGQLGAELSSLRTDYVTDAEREEMLTTEMQRRWPAGNWGR